MQELLFGLHLDETPPPAGSSASAWPAGPSALLRLLEGMLGLALPNENREHFRLGAYREALAGLLDEDPSAFPARSFAADPLGTAGELLARRDELLGAGWDFRAKSDTPQRLSVLARIETRYRQVLARLDKPAYGEADRLRRIISHLDRRRLQPLRIQVVEPAHCLPHAWQHLFRELAARGTSVQHRSLPEAPSRPATDLEELQHLLDAKGQPSKTLPRADGSLRIVRAENDSQLAGFLARLLRKNPRWQPQVLLPGPLAQPDLALAQNGLPALGSAPVSLARPSQQVLKLVPAFIWDPVDPYKLLEFVTLPHKPLDEELGQVIANLLSASPGLHSRRWEARIGAFFGEARKKDEQQPGSNRLASLRRQYRRWFERRRYPGGEEVPVEEVLPLFDEIHQWAREQQLAREGRPSAFAALAEQAQRIMELLQTQASGLVGQRELEQLIRTVYDPTSLPLQMRESGALPVWFSAGSSVQAVDQLLWWHFVESERDPFFSRWYPEEQNYLQTLDIELDSPAMESSRALFYDKLPIRYCRGQLILGIPALIDGREPLPHPLLALLHARWSSLEPITLRLPADDQDVPPAWKDMDLPLFEPVALEAPLRPAPFIRLRDPGRLQPQAPETYTGLEQLMYYPHQWLFRRQLRLRRSPLFRVADDATLLGSLAHRAFELLLAEEDVLRLDRDALQQRLDAIAEALLEKEGAVLLMYGREPERVSFIRKLRHAAWTLVDLLRQNGWRIAGVEKSLTGFFNGIEITGRLDLLLERGSEKAVIDLKWRGKTFRRQLIEQQRELQLVLYSRLATGDGQWAHTAYFIQRDALLLARNADGFTQAEAVRPEDDHTAAYQQVWDAMEATYRWRRGQLADGLVEVRCTETVPLLDEQYGEEILDVLELPQETHPYDDYRTLIRLVE